MYQKIFENLVQPQKSISILYTIEDWPNETDLWNNLIGNSKILMKPTTCCLSPCGIYIDYLMIGLIHHFIIACDL